MTWLYVPSTSATATEASSSPGPTSEPMYEPWLVLSGTPTRRPFSWKGWARRGWIRALSGTLSNPSTAQSGVDVWISSLPVSPANHSAPRGSGWALTMLAGSGRGSNGSYATWNPASSSWRTSQELFEQDLPKSLLALPVSGSMRNGVCTARPTLAPLTDANGSGSWPTPVVVDSHGGRPGPNAKMRTLRTESRSWGTPVARDDQKTPEAHLQIKERMGGNRTAVTSLTVQTKMWSTPRASMNENRTTKHAPSHGETHGRTLAGDASLLAETTTTDGPTGSRKADLNPFFVATLMGLPMDWLTHSTSAVTDSCHKQLQKPSANYSPAPVGSSI